MNRSGTIGLIGGTGPEGRGIVLRLAAAGLNVAVGSRVADRARDLANKLNDQLLVSKIPSPSWIDAGPLSATVGVLKQMTGPLASTPPQDQDVTVSDRGSFMTVFSKEVFRG